MIRTLLEKQNDRGIYRVFYVTEDEAHGGPEGLYADIAYFDGNGYAKHCGSYREAAHLVFEAFGERPDFSRRV